VIPGLVDPPEPKWWTAGDWGVFSNTLDEQTARYFSAHDYRTKLAGDCVYYYRRDAFLPRLATQDLYVLSGGRMEYYITHSPPSALGPNGRLDISAVLQAQGIAFAPGASAFYDPKAEVVTLTLDEDNLEMAAGAIFGGGCTGIETADSSAERLKRKWHYWYYEQSMWVRERLGLPPPTP
jgi:hypothetical protein